MRNVVLAQLVRHSAKRTVTRTPSLASQNWSVGNILAKRSSQLKPTRATFTTSMELVIVWPSTWLALARVGSSCLEFDQGQMFAQLEPSFSPFGHLSQLKPTLAKLFCYCYVTTRSYSKNWMVFLRTGSTWRYRLATRRRKFWFCNLVRVAWVGCTIWRGL